MKVRNIPFGYQYAGGQITINQKEMAMLKQMAQSYLAGDSLLKIATRLTQQQIAYQPGVTSWNKSRVMWLLTDQRYLGTDEFPQIFEQKTMEQVEAIRHRKNTQKNLDKSNEIYKLNVPVICQRCGTAMRRRTDNHTKIKQRWICQNPSCKQCIVISDENLMIQLTDRLNYAIENVEEIDVPNETLPPKTTELLELENTIHRALERFDFDQEKLTEMLLQRAFLQYDTIEDLPYMARQIKRELMGRSLLTDFDGKLCNCVAESITLHDDDAVITLRNHQIIGKRGMEYDCRAKQKEIGADHPANSQPNSND